MNPEQLERLLESRRSIRKYKAQPPPEAWLEEMVGCALHAPSPSNSQPVRFVCFKSFESRRRLRRIMDHSKNKYLAEIAGRSGFKRLRNKINYYYRHCVFMFDAPVLMAAGTTSGLSGLTFLLRDAGLIDGRSKEESDLDISLGLALKGFALKAHALGLGTCILTAPLHFIPDCGEVLPQGDFSIKCFVSAGFPDEAPARPPRKTVGGIYREV